MPWSWLTQCLSYCSNHHRVCNLYVQDKRLPTRLIDVGTQTDARPRLIISATLPEPVHGRISYITLSHKWGTKKFTVLNSQNLDAFQDCIPLNRLPKTFQDAISCARQFSIRYIWIDSLCILQDSITDWQAEAPTMHSVYSNAFLNIAASESEAPMEGLHPRKRADLDRPFHFCFEYGDSQQDFKCYYDTWHDLGGVVPLSQRGWVLQERLASPRTIHFMSTITWECRESYSSQVSPMLSAIQSPKIWKDRSLGEDRDQAFKLWDRTIETYSQCHLTKKDDKLVAIAGLARIVQTFTQCDYLAGMWRTDLTEGMRWIPGQPCYGHTSGKTYRVEQRAHSCSWASVDGPIYMGYRLNFPVSVVEVIQAEIRSANDDMFGQFKSGHVALLGTIYTLGTLAEVWDRTWKTRRRSPCGLGLDGDYYDSDIAVDKAVYIVPLASHPEMLTNHGTAIVPRFFGLLVQEDITDDGRRAYRRIGFVIVDHTGKVIGSGVHCPNWTPPSRGSSLNTEILLV